MDGVKNGDSVLVHYTGRLQDGTVFDSSQGKDPLQFTLGQKIVIPGVEKAMLGMNVNEEKTVTVSPAEGYGEYAAGKVLNIAKSKLPPEPKPVPGMILEIRGEDGRAMAVPIKSVTADNITIDGNHPLAGKTLIFNIKLVKIIGQ